MMRHVGLSLVSLTLAACGGATDVPVAAPSLEEPAADWYAPRNQAFPITDLGVLPGGTSAMALDINAGGVVVGVGDVGSFAHAFRWTSGGGMQDLGGLPGQATWNNSATAVNDSGEIVGWLTSSVNINRAFVWTPAAGMVELPSDAQGDAFAFDITNQHLIVGCGELSGAVQVLQWTRTGSGGWTVSGLGEPPGASGSACANGAGGGSVVGSFFSAGTPTGFLLSGGVYRNLGPGTAANRIASGRFVGAGGSGTGSSLPWEWPGTSALPFSLGYLYAPDGAAQDLNTLNHIAGSVANASSTGFRAFFWDCAGGMIDLGSLGGQPTDDARAFAINRADVVAGMSNGHAVIWGAVPGSGGVVQLPYQQCTIPPIVSYIPKAFINDGIISRPGFDATLINPATVTISDGFGHVTPIARVAGGPPKFQLADLNGDRVLDMKVSFDKANMIANGTLTRASFQFVVGWVDPTGLPLSGKYPIRVQ